MLCKLSSEVNDLAGPFCLGGTWWKSLGTKLSAKEHYGRNCRLELLHLPLIFRKNIAWNSMPSKQADGAKCRDFFTQSIYNIWTQIMLYKIFPRLIQASVNSVQMHIA